MKNCLLRMVALTVVAAFASNLLHPQVWAVLAAETYPSGDFDEYSGSSLNISVFVFRDLNRNGIFDMSDRPMNGIAVDATGNRRTVTRRSNMSGFTNYEMSASDTGKDITFPGSYEFTVKVPPGWSITTGNEVQVAEFSLLPGAPADIVASPPPTPVGLVPTLTISGRTNGKATEIVATGPDGGTVVAVPDANGMFCIPATPGLWTIALVQGNTVRWSRAIEVAAAPVVLTQLADDATRIHPPAKGRHVTIGYDDLLSGGVAKIPSGYGGLNWDNFVMAHVKFYGSVGYRNNIVSGEFLAYNGSGHPASISSDRPFDFVGGYIGASNLSAEGEILRVRAWRGDTLAHEERLTLSALGPLYFAADFRGVTQLEFATEHYWQATFEDLQFRLAD